MSARFAPHQARIWLPFQGQYVSGTRRTPAVGQGVTYAIVGDGTTAASFPAQLAGRRGVRMDGGDYAKSVQAITSSPLNTFSCLVSPEGAAATRTLLDCTASGGVGKVTYNGSDVITTSGQVYVDGRPGTAMPRGGVHSVVVSGITLAASDVRIGADSAEANGWLGEMSQAGIHPYEATEEEARFLDGWLRQRRNLP